MTDKGQPIRRRRKPPEAPPAKRKPPPRAPASAPAAAPPPPPAPAPKPIKHRRAAFCPETCATILRWLELGNFRESACARARLDPTTLRGWLDRGREDLEKAADGEELSDFAQFYCDVIEAEAVAETTLVSGVLSSGETEDMRWFLERRYPRRFGKMAMRVELSGPEGKPIEVDDARRTLLGRLSAVADAGAAQADDPVAEPV